MDPADMDDLIPEIFTCPLTLDEVLHANMDAADMDALLPEIFSCPLTLRSGCGP